MKIELHCPECNSEHFLVPSGRTLTLDEPLFTCADCHAVSPNWKLIGGVLERKQVRSLLDLVQHQRKIIRTLERVIEIRGLVPLTEDEKLRILIGAQVDWTKLQVLKSRPEWPELYGSVG